MKKPFLRPTLFLLLLTGLGGLSAAQTPAQLAFAAAQADLAAGQKLGAITVKLEDGSGNLVASSDSVQLSLSGGDAVAFTASAAAVNGTAQIDLSAAPLPLPGNYVITATDTTTPAVPAVSEGFALQAGSVAVGQTASAASRQVATFVFTSSFTVSAIGVLTQGSASSTVFTADSGSDATRCASGTTYSAGQSCTVGVDFTPAGPGGYLGAVQLSPSAGAPLTVLLSRVGTAPLADYNLPMPVSAALGSAAGMTPGQLSVDASGNIWVAETGLNLVAEIPAGCSSNSCWKTVGSGFNAPAGVAVDGAGDVFVADSGSHKVLEVTSLATSTVLSLGGSTAGPLGVAQDGNGALYVADTGNGKLWRLPRGCTAAACASVLASGLGQISSVAVDSDGNVFYTVIGNAQIQELPGGIGPAVAISTGLTQPAGLAVDAGGNLYAADSVGGSVIEVSGTTVTTLVAGLQSGSVGPQGVALDFNGNVYIANTAANSVLRSRRYFFPPSVTLFLPAATAVYGHTSAPIITALQNSGNAALSLSALQAQNNEAQQLTGSNDCTATSQLAAGGQCALAVVLTAAIPGSSNVTSTASGLVTVSDNSLNNTSAQQQLILAGTITPAPLTVTADNATKAFGAPVPTLTSTFSGFENGDTAASAISGAPQIQTAATAASDAGTYAITPAQGTLAANNGNYTFAFVNGTLTVTPAAQTISFGPLANHLSTDAPFTLSATATSGLPVSFTVVSGPATVSGSTVTLTGAAGTVVIAASQAGNGNFQVAPGVNQSFTVTVPPPVIGTLGLSASSITFGTQAQGVQSGAQTLVLSASSGSVTVSQVQASGDFSAQTACATLASNTNCSVSVFFTPTAPGTRSGTLTITDDASGSPQNVTLSGTGTAPGVNLSPAALNFGSVVTGASATLGVTITNTGNATLHVSGVSVVPAPSDFSSTNTCAAVAAGTDCSLTVTFAPTATGARTGTLTLTDDASGGSQTVPLSGTGIAAGAAVTPSTLVFAPEVIGGTSLFQTVTLTDTGTAALTGLTLSTSGDFRQSSNCGPSLAAGASCSSQVVYAPTLAGAETGTLNVTDSLGTQTVALSGTGLTVGADLSATQLLFGGQMVGTASAAQTLTLANSGTAPLHISTVAVSAGFTETDDCAGATVAGHCSINVSFAPTAAGAQSGTLTVTDDAGTQITQLSGTGNTAGLALNPSTLTFGAQTVGGVSAAQTVTLTNTGTVPLTLTAPALSGDFVVASQCSTNTPLAAGASCLLSVSFAPLATGSRSGGLTITDSGNVASAGLAANGEGVAAGLTLLPANLFFGSQVTGQVSTAQTVTVTNTSPAADIIQSITANGDFGQVNTCAGTLNSGASCVISVTLTPSGIGARTAVLTINDSANGAHAVALSGSGQAAGVTLSPESLAFGSQPIPGASTVVAGSAQTVTVTNNGAASVTIGAIAASGDFSETNTCGSALAPAATCTISVSFAPTALGHRSGALNVNEGSAAQVSTLAGDGSPNGLVLSPSVFNFGSIALNTLSTSQTATLTNGPGSQINNLVVTPSGELSETNTCGTSLANGATCTITVTLSPEIAGPFTGTVAVTGTLGSGAPPAQFQPAGGATGSGSVSLAVLAAQGTGGAAPLTLSPPSLNFAAQGIAKTSGGQSVTLTNNSGAAVNLGGITITGANAADFGQTNTCGASLANGGSCTVNVTFTPTAAGTRTASVSISDGASPQIVPLTGAGSDFTVTAAPVAPITHGQSATVNLSLASVAGDGQTVSLSCTVTGTGTACTASPASVSLSGTSATAATLTITTTSQTALPPIPGAGNELEWWLGGLLTLAAILMVAIESERLRRRWKVALLGGAMALSVACGGGAASTTPPPPPGPNPTTLTVTVTATSSTGVVHTATASVQVN